MVPVSAAVTGDCPPVRPISDQPEGISITKVSRGDRRCTFLNEPTETWLLWHAFAHVEEFTADAFYELADKTAL